MNRSTLTFRSALLSLVFAILLPLVVVCAAKVRQRQLMTGSGPRWSQFSKINGVQVEEESNESQERASIESRDDDSRSESTQVSNSLNLPVSSESRDRNHVSAAVRHQDLTGSVTGTSDVSMPIAKRSNSNTAQDSVTTEQRQVDSMRRGNSNSEITARRVDRRIASRPDVEQRVPLPDDDLGPAETSPAEYTEIRRQPHVVFHPVNEQQRLTPQSEKRLDRASEVNSQVEERLAGIQRRIDQLAQAQVDRQLSDLDRAARLLQQLENARQTDVGGLKSTLPANGASAGTLPANLIQSLIPSLSNGNSTVPVPPTPGDTTPTEKPAVDTTIPRPIGNGSNGIVGREGSIKVVPDNRSAPDDERFALQVHDAELTQVLDMLGQLGGVNIIPSPAVQGRVSLNLNDVSVDLALEAILKSRGYVHEREGDFIYIRSLAEVAAQKTANRKPITKVFQPNYINASELSKLVTPIMTKGIGQIAVTSPAQVGIAKASENAGGDGIAQRDALLVQDYPEVVEAIERVVVEMDVPPLQVIIEAKILNVTLSDSMEFGVNFAMLNGSQTSLGVSGNGSTLNGSTGFPNNPSLAPATGDFIANTAGLKYGFITGDVTGFIKALENLADTSLVAAPQIRVLNKQKAEMIIGNRVSYKTLAFNGTQTVENVQFLDAGTKLLFRPFISPDGLIRLEVHPERSSATINKETGLPNQETTEVTTNIMARDGSTVVIGGLIAEETTESVDRVPLLGAIPVIGAAFRNKHEKTQRNELIVLITPRIVTEPEAEIEGAALMAETENRAANFRDELSSVNRQNLTRRHYERAKQYFEQGNLIKARQQVDAALRQNQADLDSLRLKEQINAAIRQQQTKSWRWPGQSVRTAKR